MDINDIYLHNFKGGNLIDSIEESENIARKLRLILTYSTVSYNYYQKYIKAIEGVHYVKHWGPNIYGSSEDYVSILDPYIICEKTIPSVSYSNINIFLESPSAYIIFKREWIDKMLFESLKKRESDIKADAHKKLLKGANEYDTINFKLFFWPSNDSNDYRNGELKRYEYVLPGEIKIKDRIPVEEICGLAFGEHIVKEDKNINMINQVLRDTNMQHLPVYLISNASTYGVKDLTLKRISK